MIYYIVFLPLFGALITGFTCRKISHNFAHFITSALLVISAILSWAMFKEVIFDGKDHVVEIIRWFDVGSFSASWSLKVDSLTAVMLVVVNTVSSLVHIYSKGYMSHDPHVPRFMSYLSLFTFFMLMLVTADNLLQLFLGWEGVGLCSYLLIGFWFKKPSANAAAMKAFIVNRVGDFAFALGIFAVFLIFNSIEFSHILTTAAKHDHLTLEILGTEYHAMTVICILLFIGAMGKSAQIGLHTWLPDAMEGPTPVSALIHAATMVTAGVFLVVRFSPLFELSEIARDMVTIVGAVTCLFAATIAITQPDIKKIIAYSTCSQLGYMFFACGVSAYPAAIFHLGTHAFFKALLFLGAGSVIHAMSDEQNIHKMGGIWKKIPFTYAMMWIGSLALAGVYPFAGYFSKDMILEAAYARGTHIGEFAFWMGIFAAFLTAFYSWRLIIIVFHGKPSASKDVMSRVHESPLSMTVPLFILALGAVFAGILGYKFGIVSEHFTKFWGHAIVMLDKPNILFKAHHLPSYIKLMPAYFGFAGIFVAYLFYSFYPALPKILMQCFRPLYLLSYNKWYFDEIYNCLIVCPTKCLGRMLWKYVDVKIIDNMGPNGAAFVTNRMAGWVSRFQTGFLYHYAFVMITGVVFIVSLTVWIYIFLR